MLILFYFGYSRQATDRHASIEHVGKANGGVPRDTIHRTAWDVRGPPMNYRHRKEALKKSEAKRI